MVGDGIRLKTFLHNVEVVLLQKLRVLEKVNINQIDHSTQTPVLEWRDCRVVGFLEGVEDPADGSREESPLVMFIWGEPILSVLGLVLLPDMKALGEGGRGISKGPHCDCKEQNKNLNHLISLSL